MARAAVAKSPAAAVNSKNPRLSSAERSDLFARREAVMMLRSVLQGDARRRAVGTIKSLVYSPTVRNKKATFALVCETLKHLSIIKDVLEVANVLNSKWKETSFTGDAEKFLMRHKNALEGALAQILAKKEVKRVEDLLEAYQTPGEVEKDEVVPDLLKLPPKCDLHDHPLVKNGSVSMQGKASSMVAVALAPEPGWEVIDACAAPGNKTTHLAALMKGKGKIFACELNKDRAKRLEDTIKLCGATNVKVRHGNFLKLDPKDPSFSKVRAILLDTSCSRSGTVAYRLDHLLPSYGSASGATETDRLNKLAAFQKKALEHALSFSAMERIVYSTCSIHQAENEDVQVLITSSYLQRLPPGNPLPAVATPRPPLVRKL